MDRLKPYAAMKDSDVPWLGQVPEHWEVGKLRHLLRQHTERGRPDLPLLSVVRERGVIVRNPTKSDENHNFVPDDLSNYRVVKRGQFAMNKMKAWQGSFGVSAYDGVVSPAYFVFDLAGVEPHFFHWAIRSRAYVPEFARASDGVRIGQWDLAEQRMRDIAFTLPPRTEQAAIVRFLDHATRRIGKAIRAKQKLVKLLEEEKQAIIHRAVTRGLDPNVRLKPSGIEWLGDVPEHWEVVKLGRYFKCVSGSTPFRGASGFYGGDIPWVKTGELLDGDVNVASEYITKAGMESASLSLLPIDTVLVAMYGQGKTRGRTGLLKISATVNQACLALLPNPQKALAEYLQLLLISQYARLRFMSEARSATQPNLNADLVKSVKVPLPPITEQAGILIGVRSRVQKVVSFVSLAEQEISILREYRTRLIADVVTGKLDVRVAAAQLPDEPDDAESLEDVDAADDTVDVDDAAAEAVEPTEAD